jgi:hypothetical protein
LAEEAGIVDGTADRYRRRHLRMRSWQYDTDFDGVRDQAALEMLPESERISWKKLWDDVADLAMRGKESKAAEKADKKP